MTYQNMQNALKPFFTYYGGKFRIALKYPPPANGQIIEPFAGSAGYSVRHYAKNIVLYDKSEQIVGTWEYLIKAKESEILSLPLVFDDVRELPLHQEAKWFIGFWCNKASVVPCNKLSKWTRSGIRPNSSWGETVRSRVARQLQFIRHWKCALGSYETIDNIKATWFIDPPYSGNSGRIYPHNRIDYQHLSNFCQSRNGQVIVCESQEANWLPFQPFCLGKSLEGKNGSRKFGEAVWVKRLGID